MYKDQMLVGSSLSKCVIDIYNGVVNINQVIVINSGTCASTIEDAKELINRYLHGHMFSYGPWKGLDAEKITAIVNELLFTNRWVQERVYEKLSIGYAPDYLERSGDIHKNGADHWTVVESEEAKAIREREHYDRIGFITSADEDFIDKESSDI